MTNGPESERVVVGCFLSIDSVPSESGIHNPEPFLVILRERRRDIIW
jgi:hypothetical protein